MQQINIALIIKHMEKHKLSKIAFCNLCKISVGTLNKILAGKDNVRITALFKIAKILNIKICELF